MGMDDFEGAGGLIVLTKEPKAPTLYWHQVCFGEIDTTLRGHDSRFDTSLSG